MRVRNKTSKFQYFDLVLYMYNRKMGERRAQMVPESIFKKLQRRQVDKIRKKNCEMV